jgi:hypothetical protein
VILDTSNQYENTGEALMTAEDLNQRLIWVYLDANKISEEKLSGILCDLVWPVLDSDLVQGNLSWGIDNKTFRRTLFVYKCSLLSNTQLENGSKLQFF